MKAICVCVGFDDLLAITLPRFCRAFEEVLVVTDAADAGILSVTTQQNNVSLHVTDAFYRSGAVFNKGLAIESAFDVVGRDGWLAIVDADILLPAFVEEFIKEYFEPAAGTKLYSPPRRILDNPRTLNSYHMLDWSELPSAGDREHGGWCQIFHASDPAIHGKRPWYGVDWQHAGGCDSFFMAHWPAERRAWLPFEVLHLGPIGQNWFGRVTPRLDGKEVAGADQSRRRMAAMLARRRMVKGKNRFAGEKVNPAPVLPVPNPENPK